MNSSEKKIYAEKCIDLVKIDVVTKRNYSKLHNKIQNIILLPYKQKIRPKKELTTKHRMFGSTNLGQPRKFYTTAGCDGWDI